MIPLVSGDHVLGGLYLFGSGVQNRLQPLSDLDFGILLSRWLDKKQRFEKQIELIGKLILRRSMASFMKIWMISRDLSKWLLNFSTKTGWGE